MEFFNLRTTIDLQDNVINEVYAFFNTKTKTEAVNRALLDWVRMKRKQALLDLRGKVDIEDFTEILKQQEIGELKKYE
jgi:Arc/MetJ family transcription regulator